MRTRVLVFLFTSTVTLAQSERSQVTFSGGEAVQLNVPGYDRASATSLGGSYSYRLFRYMGLEAGVVTAIDPTGVIRGENFAGDVHDRFTWVQFGPRLVVPLWDGRFEFSLGAGGAYENYTVGNQNLGGAPAPRTGWGGNFSGGAAIALDPGRHFWFGSTPRWFLVNAQNAHDRWFIVGGEFSFRF